jgi:hypothetical protein
MRYVIAGLLLVGLIIALLAGLNGALPSGSAKNAAPVQDNQGVSLTLAADAATLTGELTQTVEPAPIQASSTPVATVTAAVTQVSSTTPEPSSAPTDAPPATATATPDAAAWKEWPVIPTIPADMRAIYERGLAQGTIDPNAFSVLGDCQSEANDFLGVYENNPELVSTLPKNLQETVANFAGSFNRYNPAAKSGSSAGSLLYAAWNDNKEGACLYGETPVDCELRVHRPSIVFIHTGTHYETQERNWYYLTIIIDKILARGAIPVLVTKADNLELDEHINQNMAKLAVKYGLPLWNFWSSVQSLPDHGLDPDLMHLTAAGHIVHRLGALDMLNTVWRAVR